MPSRCLPGCKRAAVLALVLACLWPCRAGAQDTELVVSAAASLTDVMRELAARYRAETGVILRINSGGSNTLARQIVEGAGVDVFLSADEAQMDVVERADRLVPGTRSDVLSNGLVVIVPAGGAAGAQVSAPADLAGPGIRRIAMGNPASVPAGVYGRQWLESLGLWARVAPRVVSLPTVRAALAAVQEGRVDAGLVYATDARTTTAVRVAMEVPVAEAPRIVYPAAAIRGAHEAAAAALVRWLHDEAAMEIFRRAGFRPAAPRR
jgi:molybdate transport system substrate-binding protein